MPVTLLPPAPALALVGHDLAVPLVTGGTARYVDMDHAASTPCLSAVRDAVADFLPWYSSVHRGTGYKSQVATAAYEEARVTVHAFVGARSEDTVVFTRNTTDALNLLSAALPPDTVVVHFGSEHHANLLPWRRLRPWPLPIPSSAAAAVASLDAALDSLPVTAGRVLVAVAGASNVTGEIWPYAALARVAHRHGARLVLDAAQLAAHRPLDMAWDDIDYLALSGHKMYAPFGAGALVGRSDWLAERAPFLAGGGAVRYVSPRDVVWAGLPDRQEAGSPNVVGAVALAAACRALTRVDRTALAADHESRLADASRRLAGVPGTRQYRMWGADSPRVPILPFTSDSVPYAQLAAALSAEHGIGVRHGCFCAHPLMVSLLGVTEPEDRAMYHGVRDGAVVRRPGAVRASLGVASSAEDVDRLVEAVGTLATAGPRWTYRSSPDGAECWPDPDPRPVRPFARPDLTGTT